MHEGRSSKAAPNDNSAKPSDYILPLCFFLPVSADIDFMLVSFFMPVSAAGAGAIAGAGAAVDVESAVVEPVSFALHATATTANAAATRARRFITQSPDQGVGNMGVAITHPH